MFASGSTPLGSGSGSGLGSGSGAGAASTSASASGGGGLFGSLSSGTNIEQPAKRKSIFDTSSAQAPSFGAASTAAPSAPSMFAPSTSTGQSQGLFGAASSTSAPASGGFSFLGGASSQQQPQQQPQQAGLGTSILNNAPLGQSAQQQPLGQSQSRDPAHFNSLLERQRKRQRFGISGQDARVGQLPNINMDLGDLARRAQEIGGRGHKATSINGADSRAHYLLAGSGVAPGMATKEFQKLERDGQAPAYQPSEPFDPDNEKYIHGLQEKGRDAMIQESIDRVHRDFDAHLEESLSINFEEQKKKIMQHFGLIPKDEGAVEDDGAQPDKGGFGRSTGRKPLFDESAKASTRSVFGRSGLEKSLIGSPAMGASTTKFFGDSTSTNGNNVPLGKGQNGRYLRDKERFFLQKLQRLNEARMQEKGYPVLREFAMVEDQVGGDSPRQLVDSYDALIDITRENAEVQNLSDPGAIHERQYRAAYLDENPHSQKAIKLRKQILNGSRSYLEKAFYREVESLVEKNPREARLGGRPTLMNKIRAYIRVRAARKDLAPDGTELQQIGDNGDFCWIIIFYLLRCGFVREAVEYVSNDAAFQSTDRKFMSYLTNYASSPERRLSRKLQDMINGEYQQRLRNAPEHSLDPYRMACYKIVGRCDLNRRNLETIGQGVEDWIWLQFNLAREVERAEEISGEIFGLDQICETVQEIGQKHFQKAQAEASGGYGIYFFLQILAGMFEPAVAYLHSYNPVSAVHVAIALCYYGLLRVSDYSVAGNELCELTSPRPDELANVSPQ
jgi:nuclear pore complex protein Nup93